MAGKGGGRMCVYVCVCACVSFSNLECRSAGVLALWGLAGEGALVCMHEGATLLLLTVAAPVVGRINWSRGGGGAEGHTVVLFVIVIVVIIVISTGIAVPDGGAVLFSRAAAVLQNPRRRRSWFGRSRPSKGCNAHENATTPKVSLSLARGRRMEGPTGGRAGGVISYGRSVEEAWWTPSPASPRRRALGPPPAPPDGP